MTFTHLIKSLSIFSAGFIPAIAYSVRRTVFMWFAPFISNLFHMVFYADSNTWSSLTWMGAICLKNPMDMWIYQEILYRNHPDVLIECGTNSGGSAYYFAHIFDLIGHGRVISIDISDNPEKPEHPRLEYLVMSSTSEECMRALAQRIQPGESVMAILDSDHSEAHVRKELELYSKLVTKDQYMVIEDTNLNGHPVGRSFGPGPMEAVRDFLLTSRDFNVDRQAERLKLTFFPNGWLKKVS